MFCVNVFDNVLPGTVELVTMLSFRNPKIDYMGSFRTMLSSCARELPMFDLFSY